MAEWGHLLPTYDHKPQLPRTPQGHMRQETAGRIPLPKIKREGKRP